MSEQPTSRSRFAPLNHLLRYIDPNHHTESSRVSGCLSATASSFKAASLGLRVPCSHACTVFVLTFSRRANMDWEQFNRWRSRTMLALDLGFGDGGTTIFFSL